MTPEGLKAVRDAIALHCIAVDSMFSDEVRVTILVRNVADPARNVLVTRDDFADLRGVLDSLEFERTTYAKGEVTYHQSERLEDEVPLGTRRTE